MKHRILSSLLLGWLPLQAQAQDIVSEETIQLPLKESAAQQAPYEAATFQTDNTARIVGSLNDGTPPPPTAPKPPFIVAQRDILKAVSHQQGGRSITMRKIKPIALPPPLKPPVIEMKSPEVLERIAAHRAKFPAKEFLCLGASIYISNQSPPRTFATIYSPVDQEQISFWSSADFSYLSGFPTFIGSDNNTRSLFMLWSKHDLDRVIPQRTAAMKNRKYQAPVMPAFPDDKVRFIIVGKEPNDHTRASIQSLHDLYQNELPRLKSAYESRERAQIERNAFLIANPPQPQDVVLNYWRIESNDTTIKQGGGQ